MKLLFSILLFIITLASQAGIKYVAASGGDNGNDGSSGSPWATLAYAVTAVTSGDTIYMQAGTHTINTTVNIPVGVHITGSGITSVISSTVSTLWQTTFLLKSATGTNGNQTISNLKFDGNATIAKSAIDVYGRSNVIIHDCFFYDFFTNAIMFDGSENYQQTPPSTYATGNKAYNNTIINCSDYPLEDNGSGAILMGGQDGLEIHDCYISQTTRDLRRNGYNIKFTSWGFNKGFKIYNNTLIRSEDASTGDLGGVYWPFSIELWHTQGGAEIYNNTMTGGIDVGGGGTYICLITGTYDYGIKIYGNTIGGTSIVDASVGIFLECNTDGAIIERNTFKNLYDGIRITPGTRGEQVDTAENHHISYNIFNDISYYGIRFINGTTGAYADSIDILNNVFYSSNAINNLIGIGLLTVGTTTNLNVSNNIIMGFDLAPMFANGAAGQTMDKINISNNLMYGNGNSNAPLFSSLTPTNYTYANNVINDNPDFTTAGSDFTLAEGSPAIDAGLDVGLTTDYRNYVVPANSTPDIGAYEYNSIPSGDATPVTSITVSGAGGASTISVNDGTLQLSASVLPVDATNKNVTWSISSGTGSATISSGGLVTAVSDGTVTARATANDGSGVYNDMVITISNQSDPEPDPDPDPPLVSKGFIKSGNKFIKYNGKFIK